MSQAALVHDPDRSGVWKRFWLTGRTAINAAPWLDAAARGELVGTCKRCGGYLKPSGRPYPVGLVTWYPAACIGRGDKPSCGGETASPGPRPNPKPAPRGRQ